MPINEEIFCSPLAGKTLDSSKKNVYVVQHPAYKLLLAFRYVPYLYKLLIFHLKRRGICVFFWVVNHDDEFEFIKNAGGCGLLSDVPSKALDYFGKKNQKMS